VFELLGISLILAALLTFNSFASLVTAALWRMAGRFTSNWSASARARLLFSFRTFPALLAVMCGVLLLAPAYLAFEPRHTAENVSLKLGLLATVSALGMGFALVRSIAAWRATSRLTADWLKQAEPITIKGVDITTYRIEHAFPVVAIVGVLRPRLFVARQILNLLSEEEIAATVAHENGHLAARDNLKRGLMRACRDALLIIPTGRSVDKAWSEAAEEAADENAAQQGTSVALDLASALVKIARNIPKGARPTMPAGVFLVGDNDETAGLKSRVRRLVELATKDRQTQSPRSFLTNPMTWLTTITAVVLFLFLVHSQAILASVHTVIEHVVYFLR
jgi:Zn-dependent protease with chaperone function